MSESAVEVRSIGKEYRLGQRQTYKSLRESLISGLRRVRQAAAIEGGRPSLWALRDVTFSVAEGEAIAVIGHNGAGKSTLLKILSRITTPSEGSARIRGRAGALLEVGTGFHPELTGRENVFLNGAVLGMSRSEIARKFDEIIDFAELPAFVDTPVKRYSSGMQMRLAFAVAAHLEPEILIIDEVLAVGDASFQRKCLGRMGAAAAEGRTVLFVSHNLTAVRTLCSRAVVLGGGRVTFDGPSSEAIHHYLQAHGSGSDGVDLRNAPRGPEDQEGNIRFVSMTAGGGHSDVTRVGDTLEFRIRFDVLSRLTDVTVKLNVFSIDDMLITQSVTTHSYAPITALEPGSYAITARIERNPFQPGRYRVGVSASDVRRLQDHVPHASIVEVLESAEGLESPWFGGPGGYVRLPVDWSRPLGIESGEDP